MRHACAHPSIHPRVVLLLLAMLPGCGEETGPIPSGPDGIWQLRAPTYETTIELRLDGSFTSTEADVISETCSSESGLWEWDGATLALMYLSRNGSPISEDREFPVDLSANSFTLNHVGGSPETFTRVAEMVDCGDYGWPYILFRATVDGVPYAFEDYIDPLAPIGGPTLAERLANGALTLRGFGGAATATSLCVSDCAELNLDMLRQGPFAPGEYSMADPFGGAPTSAFARFIPSTADPSSPWYESNASNPDAQAWQGQVEITTVSGAEIAGTFEFVGYDALDLGEIKPSITVTDGSFRIVFPD